MNLILFDQPSIRQSLLPFTFLKPVAELRTGILTIREKWEHVLGAQASWSTASYLADKYPCFAREDNLLVNGAVCPDEEILAKLNALEKDQVLVAEDIIVAIRCGASFPERFSKESLPGHLEILPCSPRTIVDKPWKLSGFNGQEIAKDFGLITKGKSSGDITDPYTRLYNADQIFISEGVQIRDATLNAENGPIYFGPDVVVHEGAVIRGPFGAGAGTHINMGAKVRENVSAGPHCRLGGEIKEVVFQGYSNKGHEGFLGNSVIGEWCNLGADTNTSNLKNTYRNVKLWDYSTGEFRDTGEQFVGLMLGDHTRAGINTMFNTGTVVGVGCNLYGAGFHRNFLPSFTWGGPHHGHSTYRLDKFLETASSVMARRSVELTEAETQILTEVYKRTATFRFWE